MFRLNTKAYEILDKNISSSPYGSPICSSQENVKLITWDLYSNENLGKSNKNIPKIL